ncbi:MAG: hypothetical protein IPI67_41490 [Myxococcales bacterium]|nr:hypothetical protein [Myxococcales bacterium]
MRAPRASAEHLASPGKQTTFNLFGALVLLALSTSAGCGADEAVGVATGSADAGPDGDAASDAAAEAGLPVRVVEQRNPFGHAEPLNLLVDGDFELSSSSGQYGWRRVAGSGEAPLARETGGLCRSGVTCGVLTPGSSLIALAAGPGEADVEVSVWAKPPTSDCTLTVVSLIQCTGPIVVTAADVGAVSTEVDERGWCHYQVVAPKMEHRPCLFVTSFDADGTRTLIDDAALRAAVSNKPRSLKAGAPRAEILSRANAALRVLRETTRFGRPLPSKP